MSNLTDVLDLLAAKFATFLTAGLTAATQTTANSIARSIVNQVATHVVDSDKLLDTGEAVADAMAADATAARTIAVAPFASRAILFFTPDVAVVADDTDFANLVATKTNALGLVPVQIGLLKTTATGAGASGNLTALVREPFVPSVVAGATTVEAGAAIQVAITKAGAGVVVPAGKFSVHFEPV